MHNNSIPSDSTLDTVWLSLSKPKDFASGVMQSMHSMRKLGDRVHVRLGVTGTGKAPNYRVEDRLNELPSVAYNGANHQPFDDDEQLQTVSTWSSKTMAYDEVAALRNRR